MSTINTSGIDVNYPVPGQNNTTQGFRDNFAYIKNNLNIAANEITDLQNKVVLKTALANSTLDNNMGNTLIANASTLQFRNTMYNLGNALVGTVLVNCVLGDVQYGALSGNISLDFSSWIPTNTWGGVEIHLSRPNAQADFSITFPSATFDSNLGWNIIENSANLNNQTVITFPYDVTQLNFKCTSDDCGNSIYVQPLNRPFKSTQVQERSPPPTGELGDVAGTMAADANYFYVCTANFDATTITGNAVTTTTGTNIISFDTNIQTSGVVVNMPVVFDTMFINSNSVSSFGNINKGQVYYVKTISSSDITVSDTRTGGVAGSTVALTTVTANANTYMDATFYNGSNIWKRVNLSTW